jgi:hypothetical protein
MYLINGKKYSNLDNIECECGKRSQWVIYPLENRDLIALYCDFCGHREKPQILKRYIPNPNAPWRTI